MCESTWDYMHLIYMGAYGVLDPLMCAAMWVLGPEATASAGALSIPNRVSPAPAVV